MAHSGNVISAPVQLTQDIHPVLGITGGLGYVISNASIKPFAKYKPFRSTSPNFATDDGTGSYLTDRETARKAALYGFAGTPNTNPGTEWTPLVSFTNDVMDNVYSGFQYYKPNGSTYPYRMLDFDGYSHDAVIGFKMELNTMYYNSVNGAVFYFGMSAISGFNSQYCLTPQDIMSQQHGEKMVALLLSKPGTQAKYIISTGKTLNELKGTVGVALFSGQEVSGASGYAIVSALADWKGSAITAAAILAPASYSDPTVCYDYLGQVYYYSLEFTQNLDRVSLTCTQDQSGMDMTKLTISRTTTPTGTHGTTGDWHYYNNISGLTLSVVAASGWSGTAKTVYYELTLTAAGGMFVPDYSSLEGMDIKESGTISIAAGNTRNIGYTFAAATALKVYKELHTGAFNISLILSTEPNRGGSTKTFTDSVTLGTW